MDWRQYVRAHLPLLRVSSEREMEIVEELALQLEATYARERASGASPEQARALATSEVPDWPALAATLGRIERPTDPPPAPGTGADGFATGLAQDVRHATRALRRAPGFAAAAIGTLALGIGATTAIGSAAVGTMLRPLPFPEPDRLTLVMGGAVPGFPHTPLSFADAKDLSETAGVFTSFGAWASLSYMRIPVTAGHDRPEDLQFALASSGFFSTLGVRPLMGRWFVAQEDELGTDPVAVISERLWTRGFGGLSSAGVERHKIVLDGQTYDVIGVLPAGFEFGSTPREVDVWLPLGRDPNPGRRFSRRTRFLGGIARLAPGVTLARAGDTAELLAKRLATQFPDFYRDRHFDVMSLDEEVRRDLRGPLVLLLGAAAFMLAIACVNVANLMVVRASARAREFAVRVALGASRGRLTRQLLAETALVVTAGAAIGLGLAVASTGAIASLLERTPNPFVPITFGARVIAVDVRVLAVTAGLSILICMTFAHRSIWRRSMASPADALRSMNGLGSSQRWRRSLVALEVGLSVMLLAGAGLLAQSLARIDSVDPGFRPDHVLTAEVNLRPSAYSDPRAAAGFYDRVLTELAAEPGVVSASLTELAPFSGADQSTAVFVEGRPLGDPATRPSVHPRSIGAAYFDTMGIALRTGRLFDAHDTAGGERVTIVNETLARQLWPGESPLGKRFALDFEAMRFYRDRPPEMDLATGWRIVIGVVADIRHSGPTSDPLPEAYQPVTQRPPRMATLVVRGALNPSVLSTGLRQAVAHVDPRQPLGRVRPLTDLVAASTARPRSSAHLLELLAGFAITLAAVGIYGVVAFTMRLRVPEIGVRVALGANRWSIVRLVGAEGLVPCVIGIAAGTLAAIGLSRYIESLLYQVSSKDPLTYASSALVVLVVAVAACATPVRRALRIDPVAALRSE